MLWLLLAVAGATAVAGDDAGLLERCPGLYCGRTLLQESAAGNSSNTSTFSVCGACLRAFRTDHFSCNKFGTIFT